MFYLFGLKHTMFSLKPEEKFALGPRYCNTSGGIILEHIGIFII